MKIKSRDIFLFQYEAKISVPVLGLVSWIDWGINEAPMCRHPITASQRFDWLAQQGSAIWLANWRGGRLRSVTRHLQPLGSFDLQTYIAQRDDWHCSETKDFVGRAFSAMFYPIWVNLVFWVRKGTWKVLALNSKVAKMVEVVNQKMRKS